VRIAQEAEWVPEPVWMVENIKISCPRQEPNHASPVVQPTFHFTDEVPIHEHTNEQKQEYLVHEHLPVTLHHLTYTLRRY